MFYDLFAFLYVLLCVRLYLYSIPICLLRFFPLLNIYAQWNISQYWYNFILFMCDTFLCLTYLFRHLLRYNSNSDINFWHWIQLFTLKVKDERFFFFLCASVLFSVWEARVLLKRKEIFDGKHKNVIEGYLKFFSFYSILSRETEKWHESIKLLKTFVFVFNLFYKIFLIFDSLQISRDVNNSQRGWWSFEHFLQAPQDFLSETPTKKNVHLVDFNLL